MLYLSTRDTNELTKRQVQISLRLQTPTPWPENETMRNFFNFATVSVVDSRLVPSRCTTCQLDADTFEKARDPAYCRIAALALAVEAVVAHVASAAAFASSCLRSLALWPTSLELGSPSVDEKTIP